MPEWLLADSFTPPPGPRPRRTPHGDALQCRDPDVPDAERAGQMRLDYCDDGIGMPPEDPRRISDPFFTTKRGSGGSGLGMHIVYNFVKAARGG